MSNIGIADEPYTSESLLAELSTAAAYARRFYVNPCFGLVIGAMQRAAAAKLTLGTEHEEALAAISKTLHGAYPDSIGQFALPVDQHEHLPGLELRTT